VKVLLLTSAEPRQRYGFSMIEKRFPLGLGMLGTILQEEGHEVVLHDRFLLGAASYPPEDDWDLVGIYSNTPCVKDTLHLIDHYKARGCRVAVGGPHASLFPESLSKADIVCQGEGEVVIVDILEYPEDFNHVITCPRVQDLDALPMVDYNLFTSDKYQTDMLFAPGKFYNMCTSRGCPYGCSFCDVKRIWGRTYKAQSSARVVEEAGYLQDDYDIDGIYFREDNFTVKPLRAVEIAKGLADRGMFWACESRVDTVDQPTLATLGANGCVGLYIGIESGSQRMLDLYNKQITVQQVDNVLTWCWDSGIQVMGSFITDHPEETHEDKQATTDLIAKHRNRALVKVNLNKWRNFDAYEKFLS